MAGTLGYTGQLSPTINLLMVMALVWTAGVLFRKIKQPPVLGELLAGIIFGPAFLGIIHPDETIKVLSDLGIFFLMFYAGLETNPFDLKRSSSQSFMVGFGGFFVPFLMGFGACVLLGVEMMTALFVGLGLSITAIAVNARVLTDMKLQRYRVTPVIIGASIVDDVLSLALMTAIIGIAAESGKFDWIGAGFALFKAIAFFVISIIIGMRIYPRLNKYFVTREAKGFTFALIVALIFGIGAELAGLHIIIGAYMAGLFVREGIVHKALLQKINDRFVSITYGFLGPIFFVSLSFHMTFEIFKTHLDLILILLVVAVMGKMLGAGLAAHMGRMTKSESMIVALSMNGRGAVELIIASIGLELGIIDDVFFSILVVVAFVTTLIPPASVSFYLNRIGKRGLRLIASGDSG
jgi:Kef-type K+ transport system membrane component KefB